MNEQHPTDMALHSFFANPDQSQASSAIREHLRSCEPCRRRARVVKSASALASASAGRTVVESADKPRSAQPAPRSSENTPPQLPDYQFIKRLGGGGMGVLYLYRHVIMDRLVAIKVVAGHLTENPQVLARFLDEIRAVCKIDDRNVVKALTASRWENGLIFVMEYVDGMDLSSVLSKRGPLPVAEACFYIYQAARGLKAAHALGICHRDIKPDNLILDLASGKNLVKILDFGLAKAASEGPVTTSRTTDGSMLGTVDYMAPEQIRKASEADHRADIYSLGCTFYHLLSGRPPFHGESLYDILQAHHSTEASPLNLLRADVPPQLAALVAKMMEKDRERRFQSASEVLDALRPFLQAGSGSAQIPVVSPPVARPAESAARHKTRVEQNLGLE
ncbi:MAG TPA: serine/threonine-protein kinase, partial [Isosphaeraceae bacterium]|nr:serine/threonine-protein kinase [Isosphaeraceae bacterium]